MHLAGAKILGQKDGHTLVQCYIKRAWYWIKGEQASVYYPSYQMAIASFLENTIVWENE